MLGKVAATGEGEVAEEALEGLESLVHNVVVLSQLRALLEALRALVALEGLFRIRSGRRTMMKMMMIIDFVGIGFGRANWRCRNERVATGNAGAILLRRRIGLDVERIGRNLCVFFGNFESVFFSTQNYCNLF